MVVEKKRHMHQRDEKEREMKSNKYKRESDT